MHVQIEKINAIMQTAFSKTVLKLLPPLDKD